MSAYEIINPKALGEPKGWNNGMLAPSGGRLLFVAGQVASDATGKVAEGMSFVEQFAKALGNALEVVRQAGGGPEHVGRLTIFVSDLEAYRRSLRELGHAYRELMGRHYPAMALVKIAGLLEPNAVVEIEATAVVPAPGS
jgi:enamine deaminase RidA (YjgF/YER057c/UK114 family)